jgi:hypothetical protein
LVLGEGIFLCSSPILRSKVWCLTSDTARECADDGRSCDSTTQDGAQMLETDSGTGLMSKANPGKAPVNIHVDNSILATEGARKFVQNSTIAWAEWRCKHVKVAQLFLVTVSSFQFFLGLMASYSMIGILPLVSSILGLVTSIRYFRGDISSLEETLNRVRLPAVLTLLHCNRTRIDSFFLILIPGFHVLQHSSCRM